MLPIVITDQAVRSAALRRLAACAAAVAAAATNPDAGAGPWGGAVAVAAGEEEWQVAARLCFVKVNADGRTPAGVLVGGDVLYGLSDAWAARLSAGISRHGVDADKEGRPAGTVWAPSLVAGLTYTLDVLRLVPTFDVAIGVLWLRGDVRQPRADIGVEVGLGAEYYLTRRWTVGILTRYQFAPAEVAVVPPDFGRTPFLFSIGARAARIF